MLHNNTITGVIQFCAHHLFVQLLHFDSHTQAVHLRSFPVQLTSSHAFSHGLLLLQWTQLKARES